MSLSSSPGPTKGDRVTLPTRGTPTSGLYRTLDGSVHALSRALDGELARHYGRDFGSVRSHADIGTVALTEPYIKRRRARFAAPGSSRRRHGPSATPTNAGSAP